MVASLTVPGAVTTIDTHDTPTVTLWIAQRQIPRWLIAYVQPPSASKVGEAWRQPREREVAWRAVGE